MPLAAKVPEVKEEKLVLLDQSVRVERTDHLGPWVCPALKDPAGCRFQEKLAALDQREIPVTQAYLGRKVHLVLPELLAQSDQLESEALKEKKDRQDREAPQGPWDLQDLLDHQVLQENQETLEALALLVLSVQRETKEREATLLLRT